MKKLVFLLVFVVIAAVIATPACADTVTVKGPSLVQDAVLRGDGPNINLGSNRDDKVDRMFADTNGWGVKRHWLVKFDLSAIPTGATIQSATYGIYVRRNSGLTIQTVTDYAISRLQAGKGWVEGIGTWTDPANPGEVTWNSQAHGSALWATAGATGVTDIDQGTTILWTLPGNNIDPGWITFDLKNMVQDWVSGAWENNGLVHWGGTTTETDNQRYNWTYDSDTNTQPTRVPYLAIDYTVVPEPGSFLALGSGLIAMGGFALRRRRA